jgi:hypothetical protein
MRNPIAVITTIALAMTTGGMLLAAPADKLRIISPRNGALLRPGQTLDVKVTGEGERPMNLFVIGGDVDIAGVNAGPLGKPPWIVPVGISFAINPGKTEIAVTGTTGSGEEMFASVAVDVEPVEIPPVTFLPAAVTIGVGTFCLKLHKEGSEPCFGDLSVIGTYADGTDVILNESTRINFVSQNPSIAAVSGNGAGLVGVSPGVTKLVVFGKYAVDVTVVAPRRR